MKKYFQDLLNALLEKLPARLSLKCSYSSCDDYAIIKIDLEDNYVTILIYNNRITLCKGYTDIYKTDIFPECYTLAYAIMRYIKYLSANPDVTL